MNPQVLVPFYGAPAKYMSHYAEDIFRSAQNTGNMRRSVYYFERVLIDVLEGHI